MTETKVRTTAKAKAVKNPAAAQPEIIAANPTQDGYYWMYDHRRDSVYLMLFRDGFWHDALYEGMENKEIIEGPLPQPTPLQISGHAERFETIRMQDWAKLGFDPLWDWGETLPTDRPTFETNPPAPMMDGWFWLQFEDQEFPEIVMSIEGMMLSLDDPQITWDHAALTPRILFGPLIKPDKMLVKSRVPERALLARMHLPPACR